MAEPLKVLCIIPARGGSERLPGKNLAPIGGKPLIAHSIEQALDARTVNRVVVSTDSEEIEAVSKRFGAEVIKRPDSLALPTATSESALIHVIKELEARDGYSPDVIVFLQCTSPLRDPGDIDNAVNIFLEKKADSVFSASRWNKYTWRVVEDGNPAPINYDYHKRWREQDFPEQYLENGSIYVIKPSLLMETENRLGGRIEVYEMKPMDSLQVDSDEDLELCRWIFAKKSGSATDVGCGMFSLEGKTALVTGAAGYFGRTFSDCLLLAGAEVVLFGRGERIRKAYDDLLSIYPGKVRYQAADFYNQDEYKRALEEAAGAGKIDVLVNNAFEFSRETGFNDPSGRIETISKEQWMRALESGVYWHALAIQVIGEKMKAMGGGSIINVSSMYSLVSPSPELYEGTEVFNPPSYGAAKAALNALTRYTASFYGKYGVRCNSLVPGAFPNVGGDSYNSPSDETILKRLAKKSVLGRYGRPDDLRGALLFLASDASAYMTGQTIVVDGGWTTT